MATDAHSVIAMGLRAMERLVNADRLPGAREAIGSHAESPSPPLR
jgi:hypothetical protein